MAEQYVFKGGPAGLPVLGMFAEMKRGRLGMLARHARDYGDFVPFHVLGKKVIQLNHPGLIRQVLVDNHKNYHKSDTYIRFEAALGKGLLTSNGDKWKRDRQKIQPMFRREQVEGYYFEVINAVAEKYKQRWLGLTKNGPAQIDVTAEMASMTIEIILRSLYGKDLDTETIGKLHHSYNVFLDYLKDVRLVPTYDFCKLFGTPRYREFAKEVAYVEGVLSGLREQYRRGNDKDKFNMLALLIEAQKQNPENFSDEDIRDHCVSMVFAGFETTSVVMGWMWHALDAQPEVVRKLREEMTGKAPCVTEGDSSGLLIEQVYGMDYLDAVIKEVMRVHPPFWVSSRRPMEDDYFGDYRVEKGTVIILPQIIMHRHSRWWDSPNAFIPERFTEGKGDAIDGGLYFPFSQGPRKCSGYRFAELEAKTIFTKLLPLFKVKALNVLENAYDSGISFKLKDNLLVEILRA